ncbi:MAG: glycosyltransferase [Elusimicrobia bacterium]|nr:glycosyltransferase [Elusimicrobiota bacterium]
MIKVLQVVDGGDAAEQAQAIRAGLNPATFDAELIDAATLSAHALKRLFLSRRPDVVHAHSPKAGAKARSAAKAAGVKKIFYTPHGYAFLSHARSAPARALDRLLERAAARYGETIASSGTEAELARTLAPGRRVHLARDPYLGGFPETVPHDDTVVASYGRMTRARNPDAWVLLVQRLTDSRNGVRCMWIGGGEDEAKARTNLTNMNLLMKVSVTGELPDEAAREKLREADLFVQYSREVSEPDALRDAMALGLPVVASDLPAHRDLVVPGETGFLVGSEMELLERCQELLDDADLRRRMGAAGRKRLKREFSREHQLAELSRLYSE